MTGIAWTMIMMCAIAGTLLAACDPRGPAEVAQEQVHNSKTSVGEPVITDPSSTSTPEAAR